MASTRAPASANGDAIPERGPVLARLIEQLGPGIVRIEVAPRGLLLPAPSLLIHDTLDPPPIEAEQLVFAVGVSPADPAADELIRRAARADAAGVVFRTSSRVPAHLKELANAVGTTILTVPVELSWDTFYGYVRTALASVDLPAEVEAVPLGDLFALANAIAAMVGAAVVIDDAQLRLLAFSNLDQPVDELRRSSIVARTFPADFKRRIYEQGLLQRLFHSDEAVRLVYPGFAPRLAVSIRADEKPLGVIIAVEGDAPLGDGEAERLRKAAKIAAIHLMQLHANADMDRHVRGNLLRAALDGEGCAELLAGRLGTAPTGSFAVVAFQLDAEREDLALAKSRLLDMVCLCARVLRPAAEVVAINGVVYALLPGARPLSNERLRAFAEDVVARAARAFRVHVRVGIGSSVSDLDDVGQSRSDADHVLLALRRDPAGRRLATFDDVRAQVMLDELQEAIRRNPRLRGGAVQRLVEHDAVHGTAYVETLRAHLEALGNVAAASAKLYVHPSTFRYRLRRLAELFHLDLEDPVERLAAELELRLL